MLQAVAASLCLFLDPYTTTEYLCLFPHLCLPISVCLNLSLCISAYPVLLHPSSCHLQLLFLPQKESFKKYYIFNTFAN